MAILASTVSALSTFYQDSNDPLNPHDVEVSTFRLLAKLPTIAAWSYKRSKNQPYIYPDNGLNYTANFLKMMFGYPTEGFDGLKMILLLVLKSLSALYGGMNIWKRTCNLLPTSLCLAAMIKPVKKRR